MNDVNNFIPCRTCAKKPGPRPGYFYLSLPEGTRAVTECECHRKYRLQEDLKIRARKAGIWPQAVDYNPITDYAGTRSKDNMIRLFKFAENFEEFKTTMVYIHGSNGTQKTTLAQWVGSRVLEQGFKVQYVLMQNLLSTLATGFESDEAKQAKMARLHKVDLLIIDESFSKDKVTLYESGYQLPFLDRFLRERAEINRKSILFVSNKGPEAIESQKFSRSIQDFVVRNTIRSTLTFEDNYLQSVTDFNPGSLFD